jgi:hypothetical protein
MDLGCVPSCGTAQLPFNAAQLPFNAAQTGQHILEVHFAGVEFQYSFNATEGEKFEIELSELNESGCIKFKIIQPDGTYYTSTEDEQTYECFMLRTYVGCEPQECESQYVDCGYWDSNYSD